MRIESGYLKQDRLCGQKNNRNAVGNFSDAMNKVRESISNKVRAGYQVLCKMKP